MKLKLKFIDIDLDTIKDSENLKALTTEDQIINGQVTFSTAPRVSIIPDEPNENNLVTRSQVNNIVEEIEQATTSYIRWVITDGEVTLLEETVVYVPDYFNCRIQKFDSNGTFILEWGSKGDGDGQFQQPVAVATDKSGNVYVADYYSNRVQKFDPDGNFLLKWGSYGGLEGEFDKPFGIAVDDSYNVYVSDSENYRVQKFNSSGEFLLEFGEFGIGDGLFYCPKGIAVNSDGDVYVVEKVRGYVQKFDSNGNFLLRWGTELGGSDDGDGEFYRPEGVAVDSFGNVYVTDGLNRRVQKFDSNGNYLLQWSGDGDEQFSGPDGIAVDGSGNIYVTDWSTDCIRKFDSNQNFLLRWGEDGTGDGQFKYPAGIACFPRPF